MKTKRTLCLEPLSAFLTARNTKTRGPLAVVEPTQQCAAYSFSRGNPDPLRSVGLRVWWLLNPGGKSTVPRRVRKTVPSRVDEVTPFSLWQETMFSAPASLPGASDWSPEEPGRTKGMERSSSTLAGCVWGQALSQPSLAYLQYSEFSVCDPLPPAMSTALSLTLFSSLHGVSYPLPDPHGSLSFCLLSS